MALWSNKTVQVPGLTAVYASTGPITAQSRRHYILDTTSNTITVNLPSGVDGYSLRITDALGKFQTNNVTVTPASGQKINNLATNESLILDANEMWIEFTWNALAASWIVNAPGILGLITNTYTDYPYITSPSSPASSTLRFYAKSDGKLYIKDSSGTESKIGSGLDHPTSESTFEVSAANISMTGTRNTAVGIQAGGSITTADANTFFGYGSGFNLSTGTANTAIGSNALRSASAIANNTAIGKDAIWALTTGNNNVAVGSLAGSNISSGANNTFLNSAGASSSGSTLNGTVVIGKNSSGFDAVATADNQFVLGTSTHLYQLPGVVQTIKIGQTTNNTSYVQLQSGTSGSPVTWILPVSNGTSGQVLTTNGSGTLSWGNINAKNITANYTNITGAYTITANDYFISATGTIDYTVSLPTAASVANKMFVIKSRLNATKILTVAANGSETIDGSTTPITLYQNASLHILSNGTSWEIF